MQIDILIIKLILLNYAKFKHIFIAFSSKFALRG